MSKLWTDLVWSLGINTDRQGVDRMGETLLRMSKYVLDHYRQTTLEDIRLAYELGFSGRLGIEMIAALNPLQFGKVMGAYREYKDNSVAIQQRNNNQALFCELPVTPEYVESVMRDALQKAFECIEKGDTYPDLGNSLYDWLDERGLIPFDNNRKWEFYHAAKGAVRELTADRLASATFLNNHAKAPLKMALKQAMSDVLDKATSDKIRSHAKYLAINELLKEVVEMGVTVDEFLNPELTDGN